MNRRISTSILCIVTVWIDEYTRWRGGGDISHYRKPWRHYGITDLGFRFPRICMRDNGFRSPTLIRRPTQPTPPPHPDLSRAINWLQSADIELWVSVKIVICFHIFRKETESAGKPLLLIAWNLYKNVWWPFAAAGGLKKS